jgi:hypothetical protein
MTPNMSALEHVRWIRGCRAKLARAEEHRNSLGRELRAWYGRKPYALVRHVSADLKRHSLIVRINAPLPATRLSLIAGDCFHALRSALDHLVYGMAVHHTGTEPPPTHRQLQFPIVDSDAFFDAAVKRGRLAGLRAEAIAEIKSVQPQHRPHNQLPPLLSLLRDFDDSDKHRLLTIVSSGQAQANFLSALPIPAKSSVSVELNEGPIEDGAEALVITTETPQREMPLVAIEFAVAVQHATGPSGIALNGLWTVLSLIRDEVHSVVHRVIQKA